MNGASKPTSASWALFGVATAFLATGGTGWQEEVAVPVEPACTTCSLEIGDEFGLSGHFADGGVPGEPMTVQRAADGRFVAVYWGSNFDLYTYDTTGALETQIGRQGQGPAEFDTIAAIYLSGQTVYAFDNGLRRRTAIDLTGINDPSTAEAPGRVISALVFGDEESSLVSGPLSTREAAGYPLHLFDRRGRWIRSFGTDEPVLRPDLAFHMVRWLALTPDSTIMTAQRNEFRVQEWSAEGILLRSFVAERERFDPWVLERNFYLGEEPSPRMLDIEVDEQGLLWVLYSVPREGWRDAIVETDPPPFQVAEKWFRERDGMRAVDVLVEVIDPAIGRVVARAELEQRWWGFADSGTLWRGVEDASTGTPMVRLAEVSLVR